MTILEKIKAEIQKVLDKERDFTSESAKAQALALFWVLELFDKYAEQEPCDDVVSRQAVYEILDGNWNTYFLRVEVEKLPPVRPQEQTGHCKECKYFEYDSVAKVDGLPLIVAHEICNKWGYGCKTREDGYCYLFEPQESEERDASSY